MARPASSYRCNKASNSKGQGNIRRFSFKQVKQTNAMDQSLSDRTMLVDTLPDDVVLTVPSNDTQADAEAAAREAKLAARRERDRARRQAKKEAA